MDNLFQEMAGGALLSEIDHEVCGNIYSIKRLHQFCKGNDDVADVAEV